MGWLKHSNKKWKAWIAISAILVQSLLPSLVYATAPNGAQFSEICTASGIKKAAVGAPGVQDNAPDQALHGNGHCALCAVEHAVVLPPANTDFTLPQPVATQAVSGALRVALLSPACAVPPPRGPPSFS